MGSLGEDVYSNRSLQQYLMEIDRERLLTPEEEVALAREIREGNQEALQRLISANLRFVVSVAKSYSGKGLSLEDLISAGNVGLVRAAMRYDESRGFKFISYAVWWIRQSILESLSQHSRMVRLPMNRISDVGKIQRERRRLENRIGRVPTTAEIAKSTKMDREQIEETLSMAKRMVPLEGEKKDWKAPINTVPGNDSPPPDQDLRMESLDREVKNAFALLDRREARILKLYFGIDYDYPHTLGQIGKMFNITRERVRQIKEEALEKLRHPRIAGALKNYLD